MPSRSFFLTKVTTIQSLSMKKIILLVSLFATVMSLAQSEKTIITEVEINSLIKGSLFSVKKVKPKSNLVILIAGSGPTDRNGNQVATGDNNSLKFLAEGLTDSKTSVFSYDKRILQQLKDKNTDEKSLRFDDMITDACDVFTYFKSQNKYNKIFIAGHSEGSLIGIVTTTKMKADGFISLAGAGRPINEVLSDQIEKNAPILKEDAKPVLDSLSKGKTVVIKNPFLNSLFRESVQPYLISWIKYKPQDEIKNVQVPILLVNGTKDLQVPESEAYLLNKANPKSELFIIENMNHVLKEIINDGDNLKSYSNPNLPVMPSLIERIKVFINKK